MAMAPSNILVVEDGRETRMLIAKYLRTKACNVTTAIDGCAASSILAIYRISRRLCAENLDSDVVVMKSAKDRN